MLAKESAAFLNSVVAEVQENLFYIRKCFLVIQEHFAIDPQLAAQLESPIVQQVAAQSQNAENEVFRTFVLVP